MRENLLIDKSLSFAARIIKLHQYLIKKHEFVISKQVIRSATSIGANINEANYGQSRAEQQKKRLLTESLFLLSCNRCFEKKATPEGVAFLVSQN